MSATYALVTGGGTGGHVYPALAVADELVARGHARDTIRFVGAQRGLEATVVPDAGYAIDLLPGRGLERGRSSRALLRNLRTAFDTAIAFARAWAIVRRMRPRVVVGVGGYASLPSVVAGRLHRVPVVVHEADAHPGSRIGSPCGSGRVRRCRSRGRRSRVRSSPVIRSARRSSRCAARPSRRPSSRWSAGASARSASTTPRSVSRCGGVTVPTW